MQDVELHVLFTSLFGIPITEFDVWYAIYPQFILLAKQTLYNPSLISNWAYESTEKIINGGIYTNEQTKKPQTCYATTLPWTINNIINWDYISDFNWKCQW